LLISQEEVEYYRSIILADEKKGGQQLARLARKDRATFLEACHHLLDDSSVRVRDTILFLLGHNGSEHDQIAEAKALEAVTVPELQEGASFALGRIASPGSFPLLFQYAQEGSSYALQALWRRVATEEDKQHLLQIARQHLLSPVYRLREEALSALQKYSSVAAEEDLLLRAARLYYDELVIGTLSEATERVVPALEELLGTVPANTAEYNDISSALERLKQRISANDEAGK
jgi:hypothetical protein